LVLPSSHRADRRLFDSWKQEKIPLEGRRAFDIELVRKE
jgi:hypothetical protein